MDSKGKFTREQKIVVSVWYHEKQYTHMSMSQIQQHFLKRFGTEGPSFQSISNWERKLFSSRDTLSKNVNRQRLNRLIYVPYILDSLKRYPELTVKKRAKILGMNPTTLDNIMKDDMKEYLPVKDSKETVLEDSHGKQDNESQISKSSSENSIMKKAGESQVYTKKPGKKKTVRKVT